MNEYICKNSVYSKPCTLQLHEYSLEWQCGKENGKIPYVNIVAVLLKKRGKKFSIQIESDYQGSITASNRFYLSNVEYEDRSRHYVTFVRTLHFHLGKQKTTSFFTGTSMGRWTFIFSATLLIAISVQLMIPWLPQEIKLWATIGNVSLFLLLIWVCRRLYPRPYSGNEIPLRFLPVITSS